MLYNLGVYRTSTGNLPPTRITLMTTSSIDLIWTNLYKHLIKSTAIHAGISNHTAQLCEVNLTPEHSNQNSLTCREFNKEVGKRRLDWCAPCCLTRNGLQFFINCPYHHECHTYVLEKLSVWEEIKASQSTPMKNQVTWRRFIYSTYIETNWLEQTPKRQNV